MKVFKSLNCILCKVPFARKANEARSPRKLSCGLAMCNKCFEKEISLKIEERRHQCDVGHTCLQNPNFAYFLIDILSQEDTLALSPSEDGYLLVKPFKIPECSICHDEYSNEIKLKKSCTFYCNHIVCTNCYLKNRRMSICFTFNDVRADQNGFSHQLTCPICNTMTYFKGDFWKDRFHDFLDELPEMTRQMEEMINTRGCDDCKETDKIEKMFLCLDCVSKICGFCYVEGHSSHEKVKLLKKEAREMSDDLQKDSTNVVKTYKDLFSEIDKEILKDINDFEKKLILKEETCSNILIFVDLKQKLNECTKLKTDFETFSEELMPHLRRFDTKIKGLIEALDKDPR